MRGRFVVCCLSFYWRSSFLCCCLLFWKSGTTVAVEKGGLLWEPVFYFYVDGCENVGHLGEREHGKEMTIPWTILGGNIRSWRFYDCYFDTYHMFMAVASHNDSDLFQQDKCALLLCQKLFRSGLTWFPNYPDDPAKQVWSHSANQEFQDLCFLAGGFNVQASMCLYDRSLENALPLEGDVSTPPLKERMPALSKPGRFKDRA